MPRVSHELTFFFSPGTGYLSLQSTGGASHTYPDVFVQYVQ